jgi:light-regulated signal transduction histidine kinase (bacteriophytochrome)
MTQLLPSLLISVGSIAIILSIVKTRSIIQLLSNNHLKQGWVLLVSMEVLFLLGYVASVLLIQVNYMNLTLNLIAIIFLLGSLFVLTVSILGIKTIAELLNTNKNLQKTIQMLKTKKDDLEQINYTTSHELREPITTIMMLLNILKEEGQKKLQNNGIDFVEHMTKSCTRVHRLLEGLMNYLNVGWKDSRSLVNLSELVKSAIGELGNLVTSRHTFIMSPLPTLWVNTSEVTRLFSIIIENALVHNSSDIDVQVKVSCRQDPHGIHIITIEDNGVGIPEHHFQDVFRLFRRLKPNGENHQLGLGLSISKKIVELHGGQMWIEKSQEGHTKMAFTLETSEH